MNATDAPSARLKCQRNLALSLAVVCFFAALGSTLPGFIKRQRDERLSDARLLALQEAILQTQKQTVEVQAEIVSTQGKIRALLQGAK